MKDEARSRPLTIHGVISIWAERKPEAPAILAPGRSALPYSRLYEIIEDTLRNMNAMGVGRNDRVAVVLPNGPEMAVAFAAIASGAVFAPLNPAHRASEFEFYLTDLRAKALVVGDGVDSAAVRVAKALGIPLVRLAPAPEEAAGVFILPATGRRPAVHNGFSQPDDVALVLHTSGTTSRPKIVPLTHRNLCTSAYNTCRSLALMENDRSLNVMPLFHIHGLVSSVLASLAAGGSVVAAPGFFAPQFLSWMEEFRPTWYTAAPTIHQAVLARARANPEMIRRHSFRFVRSGAAALPPKLMGELESVFRVPVLEFLGMTEAAQQITSNPLPPGKRKRGSVGVPAGPDVAIMDDRGNLLPHGNIGEIVIRGENVIHGYEADPAANESAFRNGWFRTGDQGYFDEEGYFFVTGRLKEVISRGGEKIWPREVDEVLLDHPDILQAVTFAIPHTQLGEEIGAAVVLRENASLTELQIREFASSRLADFKVPRVVRTVETIPKGATGKLQRIGLAEKLGLPVMDETRKAEFVEPRTALERKLAEIWCDVLVIKSAGVYDNFFSLGGDSVLATQLITRVCQAAGVDLSFVAFLEAPTIAAMAERIEELRARHSGQSQTGLVPIQPNGTKPPLFCAAGHDGSLLGYSHLARHLDPDQPLFGLPPPRTDGEPQPYQLEDLAARWTELIRTLQPEGPYHLAGICFGGVAVFETACQLERQGQQVALLLMLDTLNPVWARTLSMRESLKQKLRYLVRKAKLHFGNLAVCRHEKRLSYLAQRSVAFLKTARERAGQIAYDLLVEGGLALPRFLCKTSYANRHAQARYAPGQYLGSAVLLRVPGVRLDAPQMGWEGLIAGEVESHDIPFQHLGLLSEPSVRLVASHLRARLEGRQAASARVFGAPDSSGQP